MCDTLHTLTWIVLHKSVNVNRNILRGDSRQKQEGDDGLAKTSEFGKEVKIKLVEMDKNQAWLIERVKERTGLYLDSSYLAKILSGTMATPRIVAAIRDELDLPESEAAV